MALSGSFNTTQVSWTGSKPYIYTSFTFSWTGTQSLTDNSTTVTWTITTVQTPTGSGYERGIRKVQVTATDGNSYSSVWPFSSMHRVHNGSQLATGSFTFYHNEDGTKDITFNVKINVGNSNENSFNSTGSGTYTLDAIPRENKISLSPPLIQETDLSITVNKSVSSYISTIEWNVDDGTWGTTGITPAPIRSPQTSFTLPYASMLAALGTKTTAKIGVRCTTFDPGASDPTKVIGSPVEAYVWINTGTLPMGWWDDKNGDVGVTIGQEAQEGGFNVYLPTKFSLNGINLSDTLTNYIIESQVNADNGYNVYANGLVEMWGVETGNAVADTTLSIDVTFPKTLATADASVQVTALGGAGNYTRATTYNALTTTGMQVQCRRNTAGTNVKLSWFVRGKI